MSDLDTEVIAPKPESHLLYHDLTRTIIGRFFTAHSHLGYGFSEKVYANGLTILLREIGLAVEREIDYDIMFHDQLIGRYRADMIVEAKIVVEVKTGKAISPIHEDQLRNYLRASNLAVGLLLNFGPKAQFKRLIWTPSERKIGRRV
jgi:GxxExxY protein